VAGRRHFFGSGDCPVCPLSHPATRAPPKPYAHPNLRTQPSSYPLRWRLGFDAAVSHLSLDFDHRLREVCPSGIDVYFENVGGKVFATVLPLLNNFARVPVCGLIAHYNDTELPAGPNRVPLLMRAILANRLTVRGFLRGDFIAQQGAFFDDMVGWIREGKIKYREDVVEGLEEAPKAFQKLFRGDNFGKLLVRVAAE